MTVRIARWSAVHPWRAIGLWLVFIVLCVAVGQAAGTRRASDVDLGVGESGRATTMIHNAGLDDPATENVLITSRAGPFDIAAARTAAGEVSARMRSIPAVSTVATPVAANNGRAVLVPVTMKGEPDTADTRVAPLLKATEAVAGEHPGLRIEETGDASIEHGINDQVSRDLGKSETLSLPVTLIIMMVAFGAIVAAGAPVLLALSAIAGAIGISTLTTHLVPSVGTENNVIMLLGMAVGVDYSLFYLKREREERRRGRSRIDAIEIAAETSGHSVVVSAMAVIVSMAGLYLATDAIFTSIATAGIIVVAIAMVGSVTVLPALLAKFGRAIDRPRIPVLWRLTADRERGPRLWPALLRPALRHPARTLLVAVLFLLALAAPALGMTLRNSSVENMPRSIPAVEAYDRMVGEFPSKGSFYEIAAKGDVASAVPALQRRIGQSGLFTHDDPIVRSAHGITSIRVATPYATNSKQARLGLETLRTSILPATIGSAPGATYAVGGEVAENADYASHQSAKLPLVIGFVLGLTFLMMTLTFRSVVVALTAITINLLSAAAAFGVLVGVFQHSWAEGLLSFHSTGSIVAWIPLFLFAVLFGLSMDYHVFVVGRIREAARRGMSTRDAVERGITHSAGVVTSAAVVMISVFAVFATLSMVEMKELGVGLAAAVFIDAVVVRIVLLPALMTVLGRANWWPSRPVARRVTAPEPEVELVAR